MSFRVRNEPTSYFAAPGGVLPSVRGEVPSNPSEFSARSVAASLRSVPGLSAGDRAELQALAGEGDEALFWEGLLHLGMRLEAGHREGAAVEVYASAVGALSPFTGEGRILQRRFQTRLDAILGRGEWGPRAEFLLRRLATEASDPAALLALGAAGAAYRLTRLGALSRLVAAPANVWTRGFGARAAASLAGFAVEAPAFTISGRLAGAALGRPQEWGAAALGRDAASSYLVLGGLKLAGWASGSAYRRFAGPVGAERVPPLRTLFQQSGLLTGILLGHSLEQWAGLRPRLDGATTLIDSPGPPAAIQRRGISAAPSVRAFAAWGAGLDRQAEIAASGPRARREAWFGRSPRGRDRPQPQARDVDDLAPRDRADGRHRGAEAVPPARPGAGPGSRAPWRSSRPCAARCASRTRALWRRSCA